MSARATADVLQELRKTLESNKGNLDAVHTRLAELVDLLEVSLGGAAIRKPSTTQVDLAPSSLEELQARHAEKIEKQLLQVPDKRLSKPPSPFMVNELMPADLVLAQPAKGWQKTPRNLKKGTKMYDKKADETKRMLSHISRVFNVADEEAKLHEDVGTLYRSLNSDGNAEAVFFDFEGQRHIEALIFTTGANASAVVTAMAFYDSLLKLSAFPGEWITPGKSGVIAKTLELLCSRPELQVQRAALYLLTVLVETMGSKDPASVALWLSSFVTEHPGRLHPVASVVDMMVCNRDGSVVASGLKLVNSLIRFFEGTAQQEAFAELLHSTRYHRAVVQFTTSPSAQGLEEVGQELKRYQSWHVRDVRKRLAEKFTLSDPQHRKLLSSYWSLRHKDVPCPVKEDSVGYNDETKDLWMDLGFFNDPLTYLPCLVRMEDMLYFATVRTLQWAALLDRLKETRKMAERAKGATIGKVDYDVAAISVGLTGRIVDLITSPTFQIPSQQILWQDSGRLALYAAGMEMARTVFTSYKLFDRSNTAKLLEDTMAHLVAALQSVPPSEEYLFKLMTFFGSRSTEQDRQKTLRGAGATVPTTAAGVASAVPAANSAVSRSNSAALLMKEVALLGKEPAATTAWKQYQTLYKTSLEDMEPGPNGVPNMIVVLTEAVLSCGGETVTLFFTLLVRFLTYTFFRRALACFVCSRLRRL